jgi:hypothetical protein
MILIQIRFAAHYPILSSHKGYNYVLMTKFFTQFLHMELVQHAILLVTYSSLSEVTLTLSQPQLHHSTDLPNIQHVFLLCVSDLHLNMYLYIINLF